MTEPAQELPDPLGRPAAHVPPSVLDAIAERLGEAPRVSLREDPAQTGEATIEPAGARSAALLERRGSYRMLGEIARGGMGVVLRGHDADLGRDVAMKVLHEELAQRPDVVRRFVEEAQIGGQLQHPGIVPVYELGLMADERPYFTMKLVKGRTLGVLLAERESAAADRRRLLDVFEAACQTVAYAHSRGVIHRDLKPANVMVGAFGEVQVVDWGLAKVLARAGADETRERARTDTVLDTVRGDGATASLIGSVMGTPAYMPPEQASGRVDRLDERADVFALGAILCEILTGSPPYPADSGRTLQQAAGAELDDALARLSACGADDELVALSRRCLAAAPAARPRHAGEVAEAVQAWLEGQERRAQAAQIEAAEARVRATQERKARRLTLALAATIVLALVAGGWTWARSEQRRVREDAETARRAQVLGGEVEGALGDTRLAAERGQWPVAQAALDRARALVAAGGAPEALARTVADAQAALDAAAGAAQRGEAQAQDNAQLLVELQLARAPLDFDARRDPEERENTSFASYPAIFRAHGIDVDGTQPVALGAEFARRGLGADLAILLDMWAAARRATGDEAGALHLLETAHAVDPDPLRADVREAVQNGDLETLQALAAGDLTGMVPATLELLGVSLARLLDEPGTLGLLERAVELHPGDARLHRLYAICLGPGTEPISFPEPRRLARVAVAHAWAAVALEPESALHRFQLGVLHLRLGEFAEAAETLELAVRMSSDDPNARLALIEALVELGESARAQALIESFGTSPPPRVLSLDARNRGRNGDLAGGIEVLRRLLDARPFDRPALTELLVLLIESGRLDEVERLYAEHGSTWQNGANNLAWCLSTANLEGISDPQILERIGRLAVGFAESEIARGPAIGNEWMTLGAARLRAGDYTGAIAAIERSIALGDGFGLAPDWYILAASHAELGQLERARFWWERGRVYAYDEIELRLLEEVYGLARRAAAALGEPLPERPR